MNSSDKNPGEPVLPFLDNPVTTATDASRNFYEYAIEVAADEVFLMDETSKIVYVNQSACDRLGYSKDELTGKYVWQWDPQFKKEVWPDAWQRLLTEKHVQFESQHFTRDGEVFPVEIRSHLYEYDGRQYALSFVYDLTEKKQVEKAIETKSKELVSVSSRAKHYQEALQKLSAEKIDSLQDTFMKICETSAVVLETERVSIWLMDEDSQAIECKNLYDANTGHENGAVLKRSDFPGYFQALEQGNLLVIDDAQTHQAIREFAEPYLVPNGIVSMLDVPLFYDNGVIGVVCHEHVGQTRHWQQYETDFASTIASFVSLAIEINKRKAIEKNLETIVTLRTREAVQANEAKSQFLANMSHELRTPMHSVLSFTNLALKRAAGDEKLARYLNNIKISATRLTELLNDLLDLAKLESGNEAPYFESVSVHDLIEKSINEVAGLLHDNKISIERQLQVDRPVEMDFKQMMHVLINLLSNAIKFSPDNARITLQAGIDDSDPSHLTLSVLDTGAGVPPDQLEAIFDKFVQSSVNKNRHSGTGLGLPIAREIVELHGGRIWAESPQPNGEPGTVMRVRIPVVQPVYESELKNHRIIWDESYSVGDPTLDKQHKQVINLINKLCDVPAELTEKTHELYRGIVNDLYLYINEHLVYEENYLRKNNYPELQAHAQLHHHFKSRIDQFAEEINHREADVFIRIFMFLRHWWDNHILEEDIKYRHYFERR